MTDRPSGPPPDLFITEELARRPMGKPDYLQEKRALQELAAYMVDNPAEVLPRFVTLAMTICDGTAAGLSLTEPHPVPGVFRWHNVCGELARFEGATTPRDYSPCGVTIDQGSGPVIAKHAERYYSWIAEAGIVVPEVLLVPLFAGAAEPLGTLWIVAQKVGHFDAGHARAAQELATFVSIALRLRANEARLERALEAQELLTKEMSHRVKNLFAVTDSLIHLSSLGAQSVDDLTEALSGRIRALASTHDLIRKGLSDIASPLQSPLLHDLIEAVVKPLEASQTWPRKRFLASGPDFECGDQARTGFALIFHELATNAVKYGALRNALGQVQIDWTVANDLLVVRWVESGGPEIRQPVTPDGFGTKLISSTVSHPFRGEVDYDWRPTGLVVTMRIPASGLAR